MTKQRYTIERLADVLRKADARARGLRDNDILPFGLLARPEQNRWLQMAEAGVEGVRELVEERTR